MSKPIPAIILAAGKSERLGENKGLVDVSGTPLLDVIVERLSSAGCDPIMVVTRAELAVDYLTASPRCNVVINKTPEDGRTGTVQTGLISLGEELGRLPKSVLIVPVDRPGWEIQTLQKIVDSEGCVCPEKDGRGGHPIKIGLNEISAILTAPSDKPLRELVNPVRFVVEDNFLHLNIDTPNDLEDLKLWIDESDGLSR